jgi:hypothetical protein
MSSRCIQNGSNIREHLIFLRSAFDIAIVAIELVGVAELADALA